VARFLASVFHDLVQDGTARDAGALLSAVEGAILGNAYLGQLSMQCLYVEPAQTAIRLANAGHPYPVHYSARRQKADVLPMPGLLLNTSTSGKATPYDEFAIDFEPGDILVLVSDGLTEANIADEDPYGYQFEKVMESRAGGDAASIGRAILEDWRAYPRDSHVGDDVSIVVIAFRESADGVR
jgi:serine phosphatase RsbU (regulator of sigma subunit)